MPTSVRRSEARHRCTLHYVANLANLANAANAANAARRVTGVAQ